MSLWRSFTDNFSLGLAGITDATGLTKDRAADLYAQQRGQAVLDATGDSSAAQAEAANARDRARAIEDTGGPGAGLAQADGIGAFFVKLPGAIKALSRWTKVILISAAVVVLGIVVLVYLPRPRRTA